MNNEELYGYIREMENLPEKEVRIYIAVADLIKEGKNINDLKVSEISNRAGIGKGTTYEYFQSKEEMIFKAIHYYLLESTKDVLVRMMAAASFKDKFYSIMDYIWDNRLKESTLQSMVRFVRNVGPVVNEGGEIEDKYDPCTAVKFIESFLKTYLDSGYEEGLFCETENTFRKNVLCSQLLLFLFLMQDIRENERKEEIEDYVYNGMITMLNSRKNG